MNNNSRSAASRACSRLAGSPVRGRVDQTGGLRMNEQCGGVRACECVCGMQRNALACCRTPPRWSSGGGTGSGRRRSAGEGRTCRPRCCPPRSPVGCVCAMRSVRVGSGMAHGSIWQGIIHMHHAMQWKRTYLHQQVVAHGLACLLAAAGCCACPVSLSLADCPACGTGVMCDGMMT